MNGMSVNSQNHYLIQSLQNDTKLNQQQQAQPQVQNQQRFYTDTPINNNDNSNVINQLQVVKENKKTTKPRKISVTKNPNTPKRRKTSISSKEKINQMPINGIQNEFLPENAIIQSPTGTFI